MGWGLLTTSKDVCISALWGLEMLCRGPNQERWPIWTFDKMGLRESVLSKRLDDDDDDDDDDTPPYTHIYMYNTELLWKGVSICSRLNVVVISIDYRSRVFANGPRELGSIQVESYQRLKKWYLKPPCLTLSFIRYVLWVRWSNPGKGVAPFPTPV